MAVKPLQDIHKPMPKPGPQPRDPIEVLKTVAIAAAIFLIPRTVFCQSFTIPSGSMEPTLQVGDYIVVSKYAYGWSRHSLPFSPPLPPGRLFGRAPQRGDIVVFKEPRDGKTDIIKRLVGLPGDRIQVVQGVLRINGADVPRRKIATGVESPFGVPLAATRFKETLPNGRTYVVKSFGQDTAAGNTGVYVVPPGCFFMMGDNRDDSLDSRFDPGAVRAGQSSCPWNPELDRYVPPEDGAGFVPFDDLVGRADLVLFSWKPDGSLLAPWAALRFDRVFKPLGATHS
jgi:signal peptidase I